VDGNNIAVSLDDDDDDDDDDNNPEQWEYLCSTKLQFAIVSVRAH
jgi:hypothetical protein